MGDFYVREPAAFLPLPLMATMAPIRALDIFCGAGGSSCGARQAGAEIVGGIDLWAKATETFRLNFPNARTYTDRLELVNPRQIADHLGPIDLLLASPECTNHTFARGKARDPKVEELSRNTALQVCRFVRELRPRWFVVENVVSMTKWSSYSAWKNELADCGYFLKEARLEAHRFGVPQSRRRLFVLGCRDGLPIVPRPSAKRPVCAHTILERAQKTAEFNFTMTPLHREKSPRAADTIARAERAIAEIGARKPFLLVYYGTDAAGGWQRLDRPLRTITTLDRFAYVKPSKDGHMMRMLQPPELERAMGFPEDYQWPKNCTRRERIKLLGNAVAPPVMRAVVASLLATPINSTSTQAPLFASILREK